MEVVLSTDKDTSNLSGTVIVTATVTPPAQATSPVTCQFFVDNVLQVTDTSYPLTFSWNTTAVSDGDHALKATVVAKRTKTQTLPVKVKNAVPQPDPIPIQDPPVNLTVPVITGTATVGQNLTVSAGTWTNSPTSMTRQWTRCDAAGANCVAIPAATAVNYTLTAADATKTIRCVVIAYNSVGASDSVSTAQTGVVQALVAAVPVNTTLPTISGTAIRPNQLGVSTGSWTGSPTSYAYQWQRKGATPATVAVLDNFNRANAGPPPSGSWLNVTGESGLVVLGNQLAANAAGYKAAYLNTSYGDDCLFYADLAVKATSGNLELHIKVANPGATRDSYFVEIVGATGETEVQRSDNAVNTQLGATEVVPWASGDGIAFSAVGSTLTVWRRAGASGTWAVVFSRIDSTYQSDSGFFQVTINGTAWRLDNVGGGTLAYANITGATASTYALATADVGSTLRAGVTATNASGPSDEALSAQTAIVSEPLTVPSIPSGLIATAGDGRVTLIWNPNPSSQNVDSYQVYVNGNLHPQQTSGSVTTAVVTTNHLGAALANGTAYGFRISAHNSAGYGDWTAEVSATPAGAVGTSKPLGYIVLGNPTAPPTHGNDYKATFILPPSSAAISLAGLNCSYRSLTNVSKIENYGVNYAQASANGWVLRDSAGNEVFNAGYPSNVLGDFGNDAYLAAWCTNTLQFLNANSLDGFYSDDSHIISHDGVRASAWGNSPIPAKYPTMASYRTALAYGCAYIGNFFRSRGKYVSHNASWFIDGDHYSNTQERRMLWWNDLAPYSDGLMCEGWMRTFEFVPVRRKPTVQYYDWFEEHRNIHKFCRGQTVTLFGQNYTLARPIDLIALDYGADAETFEQRYTMAAFLLDWDGTHGMHIWAQGGDPWNAAHDAALALGAPTAAAVLNGNQYTRQFASGTVTIDPVAGTATIA